MLRPLGGVLVLAGVPLAVVFSLIELFVGKDKLIAAVALVISGSAAALVLYLVTSGQSGTDFLLSCLRPGG